jgi:hypothetical protein
MKLFPNPTRGIFTVELKNIGNTSEDFNLEIFNMVGQLVYAKKVPFREKSEQEEVQMDGAFAKGVYIVRVGQGDRSVTRKIVIQ